MRILVECTFVYDFPKMNSGIQRVVRNIIRELEEIENGPECIPIIFKDGCTYRVTELAPQKVNFPLAVKQWFEKKRHQYWMLYYRIEKKTPYFKQFSSLQKSSHLMARIAALPFPAIIFLLKLIYPGSVDRNRAIPLEHQNGDVLLLLDSSWQSDFFSAAEKLKNDGIKIISVIYDLIPVTHPQFCEAGLVKVFWNWIGWIAQTADGFMAISKTIADQAQQKVVDEIGKAAADKRWFDYFYLGSELDLSRKSPHIRQKVMDCFNSSTPVYLMVSTIEPRKNHHYLVDAFDELWKQGIKVKLCFVGKVGWKCTDLIKRVRAHKQLGKLLFAFHDLSDTELEYCYHHAKALTFPSFVEGFGLPIVEAMQRGLPVLASDIPVFREVGSDFIAYFDLDDPQSLAQLVQTFEESGQFPAKRPVSEWQWLSWNEAAKMLISKILNHLETAHGGESNTPVTRANYS